MKLKHSLEWVLEGTASRGGEERGGGNELGVQHFLFSAAEMIFVMLMRNFPGGVLSWPSEINSLFPP